MPNEAGSWAPKGHIAKSCPFNYRIPLRCVKCRGGARNILIHTTQARPTAFGSGPRGRRPGWAATHRRDEAITVCGKAPKAGVYILLRKMDPLHKRKWNFKVTKVYLGHRRIESNHNSQYLIPNIHVEVKTYQWKSSESLWTKMVWRNQM